jgi:spermidine synthase
MIIFLNYHSAGKKVFDLQQLEASNFRRFFLTAIFLSGISGLVYELIWSRYLELIIGVSVYAVALVLACFMLGLACGSWFFGRKVDASPANVNILIGLEMAIGFYGLVSPLIYSGLSSFNVWIFHSLLPDGHLKDLLRLGISVIFLVVPTFLMGGTFPAYLKIYHQNYHRVSSSVSTIYAVNTLGGALGAFISGFFLVKLMGLQLTLSFAALLNALAAVLIFLACFKTNPVSPAVSVKQKPKTSSAVAQPECSKYIIMTAFAVSGFTSLAYEVFWTKLLTYFFRDSIYDLAIVLTAFLTGIVIGSFVCSKLLRKERKAVRLFAWVEILIGIFSLAGLFLIAQMPYIAQYLQTASSMYQKFGEGYWWMGTVAKFGYAFLIMLIPTSLFGMTFPLVSEIYVKRQDTLGQKIGLINCLNTLGATLGALMAGFGLITLLGIRHSIMAMAFLNIGIGLWLVWSAPFRPSQSKWAISIGSIVATLILTFSLPGWDKLRMSTAFLEPNQRLEEVLSLKYYKENAFGMASVVEVIPYRLKFLTTNRLYSQNSSDLMGPEDHRRLGHIPLLLHPRPQSALVIGLGAGITLRGISEEPLKDIDCVELSANIKEAARYFDAENNHVLDDPRVRVMIDDGRNYIAVAPKKYDVITGDIYFPMSSGSSNLYSVDYYRLCRQRLNPGGLMCQWLPIHQLSLAEIQTIVKSFKSAFPNTSLWLGMIGNSVPVLGCIGTDQKLTVDFQQLLDKYRNPRLNERLAQINLGDPYLLLSNFIMEGKAIDRFCGNQPINSDDRPIIEFTTPKHAIKSRQQGSENLLTLTRWIHSIMPYLAVDSGMGQAGYSDVKAKIASHVEAKKIVINGLPFAVEGDIQRQLELYKQGLTLYPTNADLLYMLQTVR